MTDTLDLLPCPICRNAPQVDEGPDLLMADAPFISCPTIHLFPGGDLACSVHAHGYENWNALASIRVEPDAPSPEAIVKAALERAAANVQERAWQWPRAGSVIVDDIRRIASDPAEVAAIIKKATGDRG